MVFLQRLRLVQGLLVTILDNDRRGPARRLAPLIVDRREVSGNIVHSSHVTNQLDTYSQEELVALRNQAMLAIEAEQEDQPEDVIEGEFVALPEPTEV